MKPRIHSSDYRKPMALSAQLGATVAMCMFVVACRDTFSMAPNLSSHFFAVSALVSIPRTTRSTSTLLVGSLASASKTISDSEVEKDTIRVRIWQALASREEMSIKQLGTVVGERRLGDLKSHLVHVEKQAKTLKNKSIEWRARRGLSKDMSVKRTNKLRLKMRRGDKNELYVRLG